MKPKSAVLRVLYFADENKVESKNRMHGIMEEVTDETTVSCSFDDGVSTEITNGIRDLESHMLLNVSRGSETSYELTDRGVRRIEKLLTEDDIEDSIAAVVGSYEEDS